EIRLPFGQKLSSVKEATAGDVCAVAGLSDVSCGDVIGDFPEKCEMKIAPVFKARVIFGREHSSYAVYEKLLELSDEEPTLSVEYRRELDEIDISFMGKISLQVVEYEFMRRFGIKLEFSSPRPRLLETVKTAAVGYGHFEPLRHYAEVHIRVESAPRGSGISFRSECPTDILPRDKQNLIRTHVFEKAHRGILTGSELADVRYVLVTGRVHEKHTEGGDLREATYRAIRHSLMNGESTLLEPFYRFCARSDMQTAGKIMADIEKMGGSFTPPEIEGDVAVTCGSAPARLLGDYAEELISQSGGRASFSMRFDGYFPCRDAAGLCDEIGYAPERDTENTADSVFCSHGAGFNVKWYDVERYIHCK
ncbi:MAG: TetM/TetW/TetO/TetS family tetracycline resistance ribosomal protection protein, partial [Oscillospiraceae bacterium]|nr:TetM/TetW/TetO/TetS family tetracycline resistance ribosomal protection protein [Oscillospiraceae bacterium]